MEGVKQEVCIREFFPTKPLPPRRPASVNSQNKGFGYGNNTGYGKHDAISDSVIARLTQGDLSLMLSPFRLSCKVL